MTTSVHARRGFAVPLTAAVSIAAAAVAAACSPTFNWRDVALDGDLLALLPCKPDRASRTMPLPGVDPLPLAMTGCAAGGATFTVAQGVAADPAQAGAWLAALRLALRAQWPEAQIAEAPTVLRGADPTPAPLRFEAVRAGSGTAVRNARVVWFARTREDGRVVLHQAMVLGTPSESEAVVTFFDGLRLAPRRGPA